MTARWDMLPIEPLSWAGKAPVARHDKEIHRQGISRRGCRVRPSRGTEAKRPQPPRTEQ